MIEPVPSRAGGTSAVVHTGVLNAYSARASEYSALLGSIDATSQIDQRLIREWVSSLRGRVIDAGCGPGQWTAFLHELGVDVEGVDPVRAFIDGARSRFPTVPFRVGSFADLASHEKGAGGILAWYSVIHLNPAELREALAEFARCLEPGGSLLVRFFTGDDLEPFDHAVTTAYYWPIEGMTTALADAGFDVIETQTRTDPGSRPHAAIVARLAQPAAGE
ncbi:class I SAM-dependent methyltransferase [Marisediminicola sp. LYQ134]|uniref:class I SAM-dependent methyltransferase n=1 Tax=Marisediminicola sp. LYQ134 TaxID=3391061 RepID=UPI0039836409